MIVIIPSLYGIFRKWSSTGSVYIISDTHFDDFDCKFMDKNWITPQEHMNILKNKLTKNDVLIHLGDVGNPKYLDEIKSYKVLISGNHDRIGEMKKHFDEVYTGPLFISDKILLSHEPIEGMEDFVYNIHGHDHSKEDVRKNHLNLAANVVDYGIFNLGKAIKNGLLKDTANYHRITVEKAVKKIGD